MPASARRVKKVQFIVASLMSPDILTDVRLLFVLGCPSRTTAEDVLLTDEFLGIGEIAKQSP